MQVPSTYTGKHGECGGQVTFLPATYRRELLAGESVKLSAVCRQCGERLFLSYSLAAGARASVAEAPEQAEREELDALPMAAGAEGLARPRPRQGRASSRTITTSAVHGADAGEAGYQEDERPETGEHERTGEEAATVTQMSDWRSRQRSLRRNAVFGGSDEPARPFTIAPDQQQADDAAGESLPEPDPYLQHFAERFAAARDAVRRVQQELPGVLRSADSQWAMPTFGAHDHLPNPDPIAQAELPVEAPEVTSTVCFEPPVADAPLHEEWDTVIDAADEAEEATAAFEPEEATAAFEPAGNDLAEQDLAEQDLPNEELDEQDPYQEFYAQDGEEALPDTQVMETAHEPLEDPEAASAAPEAAPGLALPAPVDMPAPPTIPAPPEVQAAHAPELPPLPAPPTAAPVTAFTARPLFEPPAALPVQDPAAATSPEATLVPPMAPEGLLPPMAPEALPNQPLAPEAFLAPPAAPAPIAAAPAPVAAAPDVVLAPPAAPAPAPSQPAPHVATQPKDVLEHAFSPQGGTSHLAAPAGYAAHGFQAAPHEVAAQPHPAAPPAYLPAPGADPYANGGISTVPLESEPARGFDWGGEGDPTDDRKARRLRRKGRSKDKGELAPQVSSFQDPLDAADAVPPRSKTLQMVLIGLLVVAVGFGSYKVMMRIMNPAAATPASVTQEPAVESMPDAPAPGEPAAPAGKKTPAKKTPANGGADAAPAPTTNRPSAGAEATGTAGSPPPSRKTTKKALEDSRLAADTGAEAADAGPFEPAA